MKNKNRAGFSLMEVIVVMGIFIVIAGMVRFFPMDYFYARSLEDDSAKISFALRGARDRAIVQDGASAWGVHFVNSASGADYYQVFRGNTFVTGTVTERIDLNETVQFTVPPSASSTDITFSQINGLPSGASSLIISLISKPATTKTITVLANGQIQY